MNKNFWSIVTRENILSRQYAPTLGEHEIHYWQIPLDEFLSYSSDIEMLLSAEEKNRLSNVVLVEKYKHRVLTRGILRLILSKYENKPPREIDFHYNKHGKPYLANQGKQNIFFNLSTSNGIVVFAITAGRKVGIDIELVRQNIDYENIIERFFSENDKKLLRSVPMPDRLEEFFIGWTCMEAFLKALGTGLSFPMGIIDVYNEYTPSPDIPGETRYSRKLLFDSEWSFFTFFPDSGVVVTIAEKASQTKLKFLVLQ